ncbi:MAG: hypothetical protein ACTSRI_13450 [Promethearchaeota archaeon]
MIYHGSTFYSFDGLYYFSQLISIFEDGDLDIYNNLKNFPLPIRKVPNQWSIGPALFWAPFYIVGHLFYNPGVFIFSTVTGFYPEYMLIFYFDICLVNLGTLFYTYFGLKILGIALKKYYPEGFSPILVQISILLCTPLLFYVFDRPLMAHAISFCLVSILIYLWVVWHDELKSKQMFWIFFTLGIASLVRWQNILFAVIFLPQIQKTIAQWIKKKKFVKFLKLLFFNILIATFSFLIAFSPQLIAWWVQFGTPITGAHDPAKFNLITPNFYQVWFGQHGFFLWHPLTIIFLAGLFLFFINKDLKKQDGFVLLLGFLLQSYLWAIWYAPEAGCSFGMRGLISCLPLLAFGLGNIIHVGNLKENNNKGKIIFFLYSIVIYFSLMNLYLFALLGHFYGMPYLTCSSNFHFEWFFNINWEIFLKTYNPGIFDLNLPFYRLEKIVVLSILGIMVIITCSKIKILERKIFEVEISY